jgi:hypothetical protein
VKTYKSQYMTKYLRNIKDMLVGFPKDFIWTLECHKDTMSLCQGVWKSLLVYLPIQTYEKSWTTLSGTYTSGCETPILHPLCAYTSINVRICQDTSAYTYVGGLGLEVVRYESIKRDLQIKPTHECRCDGRLQTKTKEIYAPLIGMFMFIGIAVQH